MKLLIINMEKDVDRKEYIEQQLNDIGITNYEFIVAVNGREEMNETNCNTETFKKLYGREILPGEYGCSASHVKAYEKIIAADEPMMIIEDDVIIDPDVVDFLNVEPKSIPFDFDAIFLNKHHASILTKSYGGMGIMKSVGNAKVELLNTDRSKLGLVPCWTTCSYIISPKAAARVKNVNTPIQKLADSWYSFGLNDFYKSKKELFSQNHNQFGSTIR